MGLLSLRACAGVAAQMHACALLPLPHRRKAHSNDARRRVRRDGVASLSLEADGNPNGGAIARRGFRSTPWCAKRQARRARHLRSASPPTTRPRASQRYLSAGCRPVRCRDARLFCGLVGRHHVALEAEPPTMGTQEAQASRDFSRGANQRSGFAREQQANESGRLHSGISRFDRILPPFCHGTVVLYGRGGGYPHRGNQTWQEL
jgi:hypothetical protein